MAQIRKLQNGGNPGSPPAEESTQKPQMLKVSNTEYNMDTYIRELENNFEGWLDSTNFNDEQKNEQRRLLPIFIQKLRSGVVTPLEGGGWRDSSLEMYNERKKKHDKWGALAWFATEGLRHQKPYKAESTLSSREPSEYDPSTGLSSLRSLLFGSSKQAFINLDDWSDNTRTKRGLANRSAQVKRGLETFKNNPEKYYKFKFQEDKDDIMGKVDYILNNVMQDGIISPNEHFYLSQLGLGDISDLFQTDFSQSATPGNNNQQVTPEGSNQQGGGQYGNGQYGNTASAESIAAWLGSKPIYAVKKTAGIQDLGLGNLRILDPRYVQSFRSAINSIQDQKKLSNSIYKYFYNRKPGGQKLEFLISLFNNKYLQGKANERPNEVIRLILDEMVTNNSSELENIGVNKYILLGTRNKNNTVLMWDSANGRLSEVSAFYSPSFRNKVLQKFAEETGIYNIPDGLDWYSAFYKQGGVLIARGGTQLNFYDLKNKYYQFSDDVTGDENQQLQWNNELGKYVPISQAGLNAGLTGITKSILDKTFSNYTTFNNQRNQALKDPNNKYISFNPDKGMFSYLSSNKNEKGEILPNTWEVNSIGNPGWAKDSLGWRLNKSKNDFSFDSPFAGDEMYQGDFNDQAAFRKWIIETNDPNSGYKGIYHSGNNWYRTKNTPMTGNLLTASITNPWIMRTKQDELETLKQGPSKFNKFMQFFGPASGDIAMGIFTHQRNNRGAQRMVDAMHPNYKSRPLEVANPLRYNFNAITQGYQRGIDIESRANDAAKNFNDASLGVAAMRQGTLDRAVNDAQVGATISQDLQQQIAPRTGEQNQRNILMAQNADATLAENNRVELAKATVRTENDKTNTEVQNRIGAKYAQQIGDYYTQLVTKKQELADTANKLAAQSWFDDAVFKAKTDWESINGKDDLKWALSPEYQKLKREFKNMLILGNDYNSFSRLNRKWPYVQYGRNGGVLSLKTQALLNKVIK